SPQRPPRGRRAWGRGQAAGALIGRGGPAAAPIGPPLPVPRRAPPDAARWLKRGDAPGQRPPSRVDARAPAARWVPQPRGRRGVGAPAAGVRPRARARGAAAAAGGSQRLTRGRCGGGRAEGGLRRPAGLRGRGAPSAPTPARAGGRGGAGPGPARAGRLAAPGVAVAGAALEGGAGPGAAREEAALAARGAPGAGPPGPAVTPAGRGGGGGARRGGPAPREASTRAGVSRGPTGAGAAVRAARGAAAPGRPELGSVSAAAVGPWRCGAGSGRPSDAPRRRPLARRRFPLRTRAAGLAAPWTAQNRAGGVARARVSGGLGDLRCPRNAAPAPNPTSVGFSFSLLVSSCRPWLPSRAAVPLQTVVLDGPSARSHVARPRGSLCAPRCCCFWARVLAGAAGRLAAAPREYFCPPPRTLTFPAGGGRSCACAPNVSSGGYRDGRAGAAASRVPWCGLLSSLLKGRSGVSVSMSGASRVSGGPRHQVACGTRRPASGIGPQVEMERCIDDALRKNDFKPLKALLLIDICEDVKIKCSKQFFHKLDDLVCRELSKKDVQTVSDILISVGRCGKNISILGQDGLLTMIKQGLIQKISIAYVAYSSSGNTVKGKRQIMESFIPRICALVIDSRVNICIQQETLKKMNAMLDNMPQAARKILSNQEMFLLMCNMGERILEAGDYDLQVGIVEALCRMTTEKQRHELAYQWFSMDFIADAFKGVKDSEFETDCRIFLNLVNGMLGDKRRVFTFPCLSAFLDKYELKIPSDEKLEDFWIDFNLGSQTLSFYIAGDNDDHQWEAITVPEEKVQVYSIEVRESKKLLTVILKNIVKISKREGKELLLYFDASLEITNVTQKVFGASKYREFTRKQGISVAKTSVHILFDASGSQILVPESQVSPVEELLSVKEKPNSQKEIANPPKYSKNRHQGDRKNNPLEVTPNKRKMSEASMIVPGTDRYTVRSPVLLTNTSTPRRGRIKPPLPMRSSTEKSGPPKTSEKKVDNTLSLKSQPSEGRNKGDNTDKQLHIFSRLPGVLNNICGNKMHTKLACWTPVTNIKLCNNQRTSASSGITFNQGIINKQTTKQVSSSVSDNSEEIEKVPYKKEIMQHKKIDKVEVCKRNHQQQQKNTENTKQNDWHMESETTFKSVLLNKTVEESLIYRKKYILSKDMNTATCDKSSSKKSDTRKSRKRLISETNSWNLTQKEKREKSKGKGFTGAADSLIKQINNRYKPKNDIKSTRKLKETLIDGYEKVQKKSYRQLKTTFVNVTSECPLDDVYNFNLNGADEPTIKLGIQEFQATATEACMDNSIKLVGLRNYEAEPYLKTKDERVITNQQKKNLFSDTDTEYVGDDSKTDISWLRESKSKPQLVDYSRTKKVKKHKTGKSSSSLEKQPRLKMTCSENITKKIVEETVPDRRTRLPRRATKTRKNYKDLSNSESESEPEFSHSLKKKLLVKENSHSRSNSKKLPEKQQTAFSVETRKEIAEEWNNSSIRDQSLDLSPISLPGSLSSIEKITEKDLSQDSDCITRSLSPCPKTSSESLNSRFGVGGPVNSPKNSEKNICTRESTSPFPQSYFLYLSGKRTYTEDGSLSNSDEVDLEEVKRINLLPQKRSKTEDADLHTDKTDFLLFLVSESISPLSINDFSIPVEKWGNEISDIRTVFQKINTEFKRKCNNRQKIVEYFSARSWKTVNHHVKTMNHQIQDHRIKKLDKFRFTVIEELENFERDSQSLKDLEKEFVSLWEKIFQKFKIFQKSDQQRLHLLKASLDKNVFYNTDYEETVFTSECSNLFSAVNFFILMRELCLFTDVFDERRYENASRQISQ
ncbi:Synaptonemal complex protein 2, partial [Galemys pyrenaicus]